MLPAYAGGTDDAIIPHNRNGGGKIRRLCYPQPKHTEKARRIRKMDFGKAYEIINRQKELSADFAMAVLCMLVDTTAKMNEITPLELLEKITPIIASVNSELGEIE